MERMRELFHDAWMRKLDGNFEQVKADYSKMLAGLKANEIQRGLELAKAECEFPPSPAKFFQLAKRNDSLTTGTNGAAYRVLESDRLLTRKRSEADKATGLEMLRHMRDLLGRKAAKA